MAALSADTVVNYQEVEGAIYEYPMVASDIIYKGALVSINSAGYALPAGDNSGDVGVVGIALEQADNSSGSAGDISVKVLSGIVIKSLATAADVGQTSVGVKATVSDDQTVDIAANTTNDVTAGMITKYVSSSAVDLYIAPFGMTTGL